MKSFEGIKSIYDEEKKGFDVEKEKPEKFLISLELAEPENRVLLSENGIDPDRPCFMQETRSLFGDKEKTKGEEQRTESTLKRRKSSDI